MSDPSHERGAPAHHRERVELVEAEEVRRRPFRVAVAPHLSLYCAVRDALDPSLKPGPLQRDIVAQLRQRDIAALAPIAGARRTVVPDTVLAPPRTLALSVKDALEQIATAPDEVLLAELATDRAAAPAVWRGAEREPRRWMIAYATAMARAWKAFAPAWNPAPELIVRERERADVAAANGTQLELLDRLHPTAHVFNGGWRLPSLLRAGQAHFPDGGLIVLPLLADPRASIVSSQHDCITHLAYPVSSGPGGAAAGPGSLDSLLGIPRATILRRTAIPRTVGELAVGLMTVPSAVTHHANALVAAGLVARERRGKHVIVHRTPRGEALILLYNEV